MTPAAQSSFQTGKWRVPATSTSLQPHHKDRTLATWVRLSAKGRRAYEADVATLRIDLDGPGGERAGGG